MMQLALPGIKHYPGKHKCTKCGKLKRASEFRFEKKYGTKRSECKSCDNRVRTKRFGKLKNEIGDEAFKKRQRDTKNKSWAEKKTVEERRDKRRLWKGEMHKPGRPLEAVKQKAKERAERLAIERRNNISLSATRDIFKEWELKQDEQYCENMISYWKEEWSLPACDSTVRYRLKYRHIVGFATNERIRTQLKKKMMVRDIGDHIRQAIKRNGKSNTVEDILGYTISDLASHLEDNFQDGMNWEYFKSGDIHIDHIKPQKLFDLNSIEEFRECWSLDNLQPLWAKDNLAKSCRYGGV